MRFPIYAIASALGLAAAPAFAHPGHIAASQGHSHIVAAIAFGVALAIAAGWAIRRLARRSDRRTDRPHAT